MATQPKPAPKPEPKPEPHPEPKPDAPKAAPAPVKTAADEQRERSDEIMAAGVEAWKAEHDERTEEEKAGNKQVPGVVPQGNPEVRSSEGKSWEGSTRTTQAARNAQNPAASR